MTVNVPPKVRLALYVLTVVGTPLVAYLRVKNYIGDNEVALWAGEVTAVSTMAALNTPVNNK